MAIDTQSKRRATLGLLAPLPVPDGAIGASDRRGALWIYGAFVDAAPTGGGDDSHGAARKKRPPRDPLPGPRTDWLFPAALLALLEADEPY